MDAPESKHLRKHWLMRVLLGKAFVIGVALMITYTLAGFFLVPYQTSG
jgi:purine-cytosine permease-like protein